MKIHLTADNHEWRSVYNSEKKDEKNVDQLAGRKS